MKIIKTKFNGLKIYRKNTYKDNRGYFRELFVNKNLSKNFPFEVMSYSKKKCSQRITSTDKKSTRKICNCT